MEYTDMEQIERRTAHIFAYEFIFKPINKIKEQLDEVWGETPDVAVEMLIDFLKNPEKLIGFTESELRLIGDRWDVLWAMSCEREEHEAQQMRIYQSFQKTTPRRKEQ